MITQKIGYNSIARFYGLSSDTKPTDCPNGSKFIEIDTALTYAFDKEGGDWYEISSAGGGGGGGGEGGITPVGTKQITISEAGVRTEDVARYANVKVTVPEGEVSMPLLTRVAPTITIGIDSNGKISAAANGSGSVTPTVTEGWVSEVGSGGVTVVGTKTLQMETMGGHTVSPREYGKFTVPAGTYVTGKIAVGAPVLEDVTVTPSQEVQTITPSSDFYYAMSSVTVNPIPSEYVVPTGSKTIVSNGTHNVAGFQSVSVAVPTDGSSPTDTLTQLLTNTLVAYRGTGVTVIPANMFAGRTNLTEVALPSVLQLGDASFKGCSSLTQATLNYSFSGTIPSECFYGCNLSRFETSATSIGANAFRENERLNTVFLDSSRVVTLTNVNAFDLTPFKQGGAGGSIYVPSELVEAYETATNWSIIAGRFPGVFKAISDEAED